MYINSAFTGFRRQHKEGAVANSVRTQYHKPQSEIFVSFFKCVLSIHGILFIYLFIFGFTSVCIIRFSNRNDQIEAISTTLPVDKADLKKFFPK